MENRPSPLGHANAVDLSTQKQIWVDPEQPLFIVIRDDWTIVLTRLQ